MRYPPATWKGNGKSGGTYVGLPWRVVLHTTETAGIPGYRLGYSAPHLTYFARDRKWVQHTDTDTAARALRNESGGVQTNRANVLQVEIVCYSAKAIADQSSKRTWVGDLTSENLDDIRDFLFWANENYGVKLEWAGKQAFTYGQANAPGFRLTDWEWLECNYVVGHQLVPENSHWDPGALDWEYLMAFTKHEIEELKRMVAALDQVNSNGSFAQYAVEMVRKERDKPLHVHPST